MEESSDEDEGWDEESQDSQDEGQAESGAQGLDLSKLLSGATSDSFLSEVEDEDPDWKSDPLYSVDLKQYLVTFLREFCQQPYFSHFAPHLNQQEVRLTTLSFDIGFVVNFKLL